MTDNFKPEIIAFCCRHCAYAAADLAGSMRLDYPTSLKIIELPEELQEYPFSFNLCCLFYQKLRPSLRLVNQSSPFW